mgnify:CR=1 FL=1
MSINISNNSVKYKDSSNSWVGLNNVFDGVKELPTVTTGDNGKVLQVVNGNWELGNASLSGDYLPLSGGTLTGGLAVNETVASIRTGTEQSYLKVQNSIRNGGVMISNSGRFGLWDNSNNKWLIYNDENGLNKFGNAVWESDMRWRLGDGTASAGYVALRRMGSAGSYTVGLPYIDANGNTTYHNLINADGSRAWVARSGDTISGNLTVNGTIKGKMAASDFRSYNDAGMKFNQYGNIQSLSNETANTWEIVNYSGTATFRVRYSDGFVTANGGFHVSTSSYEAGRIELAGASPYIDFHSQNSTTDYTSRIMDVGSGLLRIQSKTHVVLQANGYSLYFGKGLSNDSLTSLTPRTTAGAGTDKLVLGAADARWYQVYCRNSAMSTSDIRDKNIFEFTNFLRVPHAPRLSYYNTCGNTRKIFAFSEAENRLKSSKQNLG